jgi:hypothetical protein
MLVGFSESSLTSRSEKRWQIGTIDRAKKSQLVSQTLPKGSSNGNTGCSKASLASL